MSQYYNTPSYSPPSPAPAPATSPSTPADPITVSEPIEVTTPDTTSQTVAQESTQIESVGEIPQSLKKLFTRNNRNFDGTTLTEKTSPNEISLTEQQRSTLLQRQSIINVSSESETFFKFLESKGVSFGVFAEEPAYALNFTNQKGERGSYPPDQTARYHMVQMLTAGFSIHGFNTPLSNESIKFAHKELSIEKIAVMRAAYEANKNIRPFLFPIEIREGALTVDEVSKLISLGGEFFSYVSKNKPLVVRENQKYAAANIRSIPLRKNNTSVPCVTDIQPDIANPGDLWFNTSNGNVFLFTKIDNQTYWVEV